MGNTGICLLSDDGGVIIMVKIGIIGLVIGLVTAVIVLPVLVNVLTPTHTLNQWVNDSITFTDEGDVGIGQTSDYPINGQLTQCANNTAVFTVPGECNVSTASNGTIQVIGVQADSSTLNLSYAWEDTSYLDTAVERNISKVIFTMVLLGIFIFAATMITKGGGV